MLNCMFIIIFIILELEVQLSKIFTLLKIDRTEFLIFFLFQIFIYITKKGQSW